MANNHRIVADGNDWMRDVERRVNRQERRPAAPDVNAVFGTAIRQHSRQIADWNDPEALRNGWYYTEAFGINTPDPDYMWMGECIVTYDGHGTQTVWSHGAPVLYQFVRTFHWHDNEAPDFGAWRQVFPTPVFLGSVDAYGRVGSNGTGWYPNVGTWERAFDTGNLTTIAGTRLVQIGFDGTARSGANAACFWRMGVDGVALIGPTGWRRHNTNDPSMPLGASWTQWWQPTVSTFNIYVDINVDTGGGGISVATANFSVHCFA